MLEELQAETAMANQKSSGLDGLPIEVYKCYGSILLKKLLDLLNWVAREGRLPASMTEATIVVLPMKGKDPLEVSLNRPMSLLCLDIKILAKVLAARLNRIIVKLIHPDQSGFIPDRSTSCNIQQIYLNIQTLTVHKGHFAFILRLRPLTSLSGIISGGS